MLWSIVKAVLILVVSVSVAKFIVVPAVKWLMVTVFEELEGEEGALRTARQLLAYPVTGLLGRQRKARRGDEDADLELFLIDVAVGTVLSTCVQGFLLTLFTIGGLGVLTVIGVVLFE